MAELSPEQQQIGVTAVTPAGTPEILITPRAPGADGTGAGGADGIGESPDQMPSALAAALAPESDLGEPTTPDAADTNAAEAAMVQLAMRRRTGAALGWLAQNIPQQKTPQQAAQPPAPEEADDAGADEPAQPEAPASTPPPPAEPAAPEQQTTAGGRAAADIGTGVLYSPIEVLGGIRDAVQSSIDLAEWIGGKTADLGDIIAGRPSGKWRQPSIAGTAGPQGVELPKIEPPIKTVTGGVIRSVAQFLTGFGAAGKIAKAAGVAGRLAPTAEAMAKGAFSDFTAFEGQDAKLSDLVQQYPELRNPVTEFLSSQPGDNEAEGRFKRAIEGLGLGALTEGFFRGVKFLRDARRAAKAAEAAGVHQTNAPVAAPAAPAPAKTLLGDEGAPLSVRRPPEPEEVGRIVDEGKALARERPIVETPMPSGANSSKDLNGPVYVDPRVPEELRRPVAVHETVEQMLMARGVAYKQAHEIATAAERQAVEAAGMDWDHYTRQWDGLLKAIEHDTPRDAPMPKDLHVDPWQAIGHHSGKPEGTGVPEDVVARGIAGAAADQRVIDRMAINNPAAAAQAEAAGMTPLGGGKMYVNFARINTTADVKRVLQDAADAFKDDIDEARRGVRTHEQTRAAAAERDAWADLMERRQGAPLNAEQTVAARNLWEASGRKLLDVADAAAADPSPENLYALRKMLAVHQTIQREVMAARTETARALDAWRIPAKGGAARLKAIQDLLNTYGGDGVSELMAKQIASLRTQPNWRGALDNFVERGFVAKMFGAAREAYTNGLLYAPTTHVKVFASTMSNLGYGLIERAAAARWSQALGSGEVVPGEAAAMYAGQRAAIGAAWRLALAAFRSGQSEFGHLMEKEAPHLASELRGAGASKYHDYAQREISADNWKLASGKWEDPHNWLGNGVDALGEAINFPGRLIAAVHDDFPKMVGYGGEKGARAFRRASDEVARGVITKDELPARYADLYNNPPDDIRLGAVNYALYMNFTDRPGMFVQALNRMEAKWARAPHAGGQVGAFLLRMILPFRATPSRLFWSAVSRSPLAPLARSYHDAIKAGGAAADIARARMALGTLAMWTVLDLALDGHITGNGPMGQRKLGERQALLRSGWQPYSLRLPLGPSAKNPGEQKYRYVSYNQIDPFGMQLGASADLAEIINNAPVLDRDTVDGIMNAGAATAFAFGHNILDKTWMISVAELVEAFIDPDSSAGRFVQQLPAGYAPNILRWARRQTDTTVRDARGIIAELKNRIPGLSSELPPARDFWGRVRTYQSGMGAVYDAVIPAPARTFDPEPIDKAMLDNGFSVQMPAHTLSFGKSPQESLYLRDHPELYSRFLEIRGQMKPSEMPGKPLRDVGFINGARVHALTSKELLWKKYGDVSLLDLLNDIVSGTNNDYSPPYEAGSGGADGGKAKLIKHIVAAYTRAAKGALLSEAPALAEKLKADREQKVAPMQSEILQP